MCTEEVLQSSNFLIKNSEKWLFLPNNESEIYLCLIFIFDSYKKHCKRCTTRRDVTRGYFTPTDKRTFNVKWLTGWSTGWLMQYTWEKENHFLKQLTKFKLHSYTHSATKKHNVFLLGLDAWSSENFEIRFYPMQRIIQLRHLNVTVKILKTSFQISLVGGKFTFRQLKKSIKCWAENKWVCQNKWSSSVNIWFHDNLHMLLAWFDRNKVINICCHLKQRKKHWSLVLITMSLNVRYL